MLAARPLAGAKGRNLQEERKAFAEAQRQSLFQTRSCLWSRFSVLVLSIWKVLFLQLAPGSRRMTLTQVRIRQGLSCSHAGCSVRGRNHLLGFPEQESPILELFRESATSEEAVVSSFETMETAAKPCDKLVWLSGCSKAFKLIRALAN